jgi:hypothetical protein
MDGPKSVSLRFPSVPPAMSEFYKILDWAKEHCPNYITNDGCIYNDDLGLYECGTEYTFYFGDAKDATLFRLRWHNQTD